MTKDLPLLQNITPDEIRLAAMMKALGNPVRFRIMEYLAEHQACITGDIVEFTTLAQSTVSQHLKVLRDAGLVDGEVEGPATCYCVSLSGMQFFQSQIDKWIPVWRIRKPTDDSSQCCKS